jgi:hypothetical protein
MAPTIINLHGRKGRNLAPCSPISMESIMSKKLKHKNRESKKDRAKDKDDQATPRDDDRDSTVPDDQKRAE